MAVATAQVAFDTARTLLNDDAGTIFTNAVLLPKLVQAFRELQDELRRNDASIMVTTTSATVAIAATTYAAITDILEPITLWEKATAAADSTYVPMTEYSPLPIIASSTTLRYWYWDGTNINFIASTVARTVRVLYWRSLTTPTSAASSLIFTSAENFLAPRTAALMAGSLGEEKVFQVMSQLASVELSKIIDANRGRMAPGASAGSTRS